MKHLFSFSSLFLTCNSHRTTSFALWTVIQNGYASSILTTRESSKHWPKKCFTLIITQSLFPPFNRSHWWIILIMRLKLLHLMTFPLINSYHIFRSFSFTQSNCDFPSCSSLLMLVFPVAQWLSVCTCSNHHQFGRHLLSRQ